MKYGGDVYKNFFNAVNHGNEVYQKGLLTDEIARTIEFYPDAVVQALRESKIPISNQPTTRKIIDSTVYGVYHSPIFRAKLAKVIVDKNPITIPLTKPKVESDPFMNADGEGGEPTGGGGGQAAGQWVSGISGALGGLFQVLSTRQQQKAMEEQTRQELYHKLSQQQKNYAPYIITGVLAVLAIVAVAVSIPKKTSNA